MMSFISIIAFYQEIEFPTISEHFSDGQKVVFWVGCWLVVFVQITMIIYFWSTWIKGAYMNSGSGVKEKDKSLELHEVRELKKDVFQYISMIIFIALAFTIPLLDKGHVYPISVIAIVGTGAFGNTILNLFEKAKVIIKGNKTKVEEP